jgi:Domain of unknown function (DUF4410)
MRAEPREFHQLHFGGAKVKKVLALFMFVSLLVPVVSFAKVKAPDVLDDETIITETPLTGKEVIGIRPFAIDDVDYQSVDDEEMKKMKHEIKDYQKTLAKDIKNNLEDYGYKAVILNDEDKGNADIIMEGKISMVNLGSTAARVIFGFGAGQCGIGVKGSLVNAKNGDKLAEFEHESTSGMDERYDKWGMVEKEVHEMADDLAEFVDKLKQ